MTQTTFLLGQGAALLGTATWVLVARCFFYGPTQAGRVALRAYRDGLDAKLRFLRVRYSASRIVGFQLGMMLLVLGSSAVGSSVVPLMVLPMIALLPKIYLERKAAARVTAIEAQIEPWLVAVANALKAIPSLGESIASTVSLLSAPMSEEIDLLVKEYELGTALDRALEQMASRISSKTLSGAVLALQIARNSGGNLPEMLENAAVALRELARLEGVVRTKTAEGKAQAFVIGSIPVPMVVLIHHIDNHFFDALFNTFAGHLIMAGAAGLWLFAILLSLKILAVDV